MSKSAVDVAMVGIALDYHAIAGVGFASLFWGLVFALAVAALMYPELRTESGTYAADVDERTGLTRGYVRVDVDDVTDDPVGTIVSCRWTMDSPEIGWLSRTAFVERSAPCWLRNLGLPQMTLSPISVRVTD